MGAEHPAITAPFQIADSAIGAADLSRLADIVRRREVRRIAYFHCDHFEPWRTFAGSSTHQQNAEDVRVFAESSAKNEFARRLTLFYKAHVPITESYAAQGADRAAPDDMFGFMQRTPAQVSLFTDAIQYLRSRVDHEFQVHIHHENFTSNSGHRDPRLIEYFSDPKHGHLDEARVELVVKRTLEAIREETRLPMDRWFFVHGVWALNASDTRVCRVTDEIAMLMRNGCLGDFTFPAGRSDLDPVFDEPFFVRPYNAPRAYDLAEAKPERAWGNAQAAASKFFIWASKIQHSGASVDYFSDWLREKLESPVPFASEILEQSVVKDGTLWIKSHGHSMHPQ